MGRKQIFDKPVLISQFLSLRQQLGRLPKKRDINESTTTACWSTFLKAFASIGNIYKEANVVPPYYKLTDDMLYDLHLHKNKKIDEISAITGRTKNHIRERLSKIGILRDFRSELALSQVQHEIIEGILISDGYIPSKNWSSIYIGQRVDRREFVEFISKSLPFEYAIKVYSPKEHWKSKVVNPESRYMSHSYPIISKYATRWYPEGKKIVPSDFEISKTALLYWYCGDGDLHKGSNCLRLHTNCFSRNDVNELIIKFKNIGIHATISKKNVIMIRAQSTNTFFDYIGWECPFACFSYKWPSRLNKEHRMTIEEKQVILDKRLNGYSVAELATEYGYSTVAIHRMLRMIKRGSSQET